MDRIRDILLAHYIGAITIGLVLAQAIFGFVNALVQAITTYWALQQARGVMEQPRSYSLTNLIASLATVALYLLICFVLIRWLYFEAETESPHGEEDSQSDGGTP
jgi:hypothetical protein